MAASLLSADAGNEYWKSIEVDTAAAAGTHRASLEDMKTGMQRSIETRETILKTLSDDENAKASSVETAMKLNEGDEYLDLDRLDQGVRQADGLDVAMGRVLARKALLDSTWTAILKKLAVH